MVKRRYSGIDREHIESERGAAEPMLDLVRGEGSLWHRTSVASLRKILSHGAIEPNDGRFDVTTAQSNSCMSRHLGAISLFDFDSCEKNEIILHAMMWRGFFFDQGVATVVIEINPLSLSASHLVRPWEMSWEEKTRVSPEGREHYPTIIPAVEVFYKGTIHVEAFMNYLVFKKGKALQFKLVSAKEEEEGLARIEFLESSWSK